MGLIPFGTRRVGFWMPGLPERTLDEVPPELSPAVVGTLDPTGVSLIVAAADPTDAPEWAVVLYAKEGAAVVVEWDALLFVGLGPEFILIDETGKVVATGALPGEELVAARTVPAGLALLTRTAAAHVGPTLDVQWRTELGQGEFQFMGETDGRWNIVHLKDDDAWDSLELDARTGALLSRG